MVFKIGSWTLLTSHVQDRRFSVKKLIAAIITITTLAMPLQALADWWQMGYSYGPQMPSRWAKITSMAKDHRGQPPAPKGKPPRYAIVIIRNRDGQSVWIDQLIKDSNSVIVNGNTRIHNSRARPIPSVLLWLYSDSLVPEPGVPGQKMHPVLQELSFFDVVINRTAITGDGSYTKGTETLVLTFDRALYADGHGKVLQDDNWGGSR
jgi:hypothetical protein